MSCDPNITHEFILSHPEIFKKVKFTEAPKLEVGEILYYFYKIFFSLNPSSIIQFQ
jgi:hypothetical protein